MILNNIAHDDDNVEDDDDGEWCTCWTFWNYIEEEIMSDQ